MEVVYYWNDKYGRVTFNHTQVWCKTDGTWHGQFVDATGIIVNLPLSEVCLYDFQDVEFVVVDVLIVTF